MYIIFKNKPVIGFFDFKNIEAFFLSPVLIKPGLFVSAERGFYNRPCASFVMISNEWENDDKTITKRRQNMIYLNLIFSTVITGSVISNQNSPPHIYSIGVDLATLYIAYLVGIINTSQKHGKKKALTEAPGLRSRCSEARGIFEEIYKECL